MNSATLRRLCGWVASVAAGSVVALLAGTTPLRAIEPLGLPSPSVAIPSVPPVPVASGAPLPTVSPVTVPTPVLLPTLSPPVTVPTPVPLPTLSPPVTVPPANSPPIGTPTAPRPSPSPAGDNRGDAVGVPVPIVGPIVGAIGDLVDRADPSTDVSTDSTDPAGRPSGGTDAGRGDSGATGVREPAESGTLSPSASGEDPASSGGSLGPTPDLSQAAGSQVGASAGHQADDVAATVGDEASTGGQRGGADDQIGATALIADGRAPGRSPLENTVAAVGAVAGVGALLVAFELAKLQGGLAAASLFTEWLRRQLKEKRMSQRQLAQQSGVDHSTISRLVKGERAPSLGTATKLARGLREIQSDDEGPRYFGNVDQNIVPSLRIEYALRGDDALEESDVRQLMQAYFLLRRGRLHARRAPARGSTADAKPRATMRQIQERAEHPDDRGAPRSPDDADRRSA